MRWITVSSYCKVYTASIDSKNVMRSDGYSICKICIGERVSYELWKLPTQKLIGSFASYDEARSKLKQILNIKDE